MIDMNAFSEKLMEDAIVANPFKFIKEDGLTLIARQYRISSYIFDLLFEDRHGGKLIVEIQKGTLDRTHTYKILDYYHEFKEKNPFEYIDIMVIANIIPHERKKRLGDLGIAFKEIPVSSFINNSKYSLMQENDSDMKSDTDMNQIKSSDEMTQKYSSVFIKNVHDNLLQVVNKNWIVSGRDSLKARHLPTIKKIEDRFGKGISAQIWMERPYRGYARCKFEMAQRIMSMSESDSKVLRENIAMSIRSFFINKGLPEIIETATGSTIIAVRIFLSRIQDVKDDISPNIDLTEINKIIDFYKYLNNYLNDWIDENLIDLI